MNLEREEILSEVPDEEREDIQVGLAYPEDSAGRRMQTDFVSVGLNWTVGQTIDFLRDEEDLPDEFLDVFVVDERYQGKRGDFPVSNPSFPPSDSDA